MNSNELDAMIARERQAEAAATNRRRRLSNRPKSPDACPQGHPYTPENTYRRASGGRLCLKCWADRRIYNDRPARGRRNRQGEPVIDLTNPHQTR